MAKVSVAVRIRACHYAAIKEEMKKGKTLTGVFEEMLNERFPASSGFFRNLP